MANVINGVRLALMLPLLIGFAPIMIWAFTKAMREAHKSEERAMKEFLANWKG